MISYLGFLFLFRFRGLHSLAPLFPFSIPVPDSLPPIVAPVPLRAHHQRLPLSSDTIVTSLQHSSIFFYSYCCFVSAILITNALYRIIRSTWRITTLSSGHPRTIDESISYPHLYPVTDKPFLFNSRHGLELSRLCGMSGVAGIVMNERAKNPPY